MQRYIRIIKFIKRIRSKIRYYKLEGKLFFGLKCISFIRDSPSLNVSLWKLISEPKK